MAAVASNYINPDITTEDELEVPGGKLSPGTVFRLKGDKRTKYVFVCYATNSKLESSWVDAFEEAGGFKSVRVDDIILPKEKRRRVTRTKNN